MKRSLAIALVLCCSFIFLWGSYPEAHSNTSIEEYDRQIQAAKDRQNYLEKVIEKSRMEIRILHDKESTIKNELNQLEHEISLLANELSLIRAQEELYRIEYTRIIEENFQLQESIKEKEASSRQLIITLYKNYMLNYTAFLLSSRSINEIIDNSLFLQYLFEADKSYFMSMKQEKARLQENQIRQVGLQESLFLAKSQKEKKEEELLSMEKEKSREVELIIAQKYFHGAEQEKYIQEHDALEYQTKILFQEREEAIRRQKIFDSPMGPVIWPLSGRMTSGFGMRLHPIFGVQRMHTGIDIDAPAGTPIVSVAYGVVTYAGWLGGYGNTIIIQHDDNHASLYAHMRSYAVDEKKIVQQGEVIGYVGSTGWSTGPHLHFEIRINGDAVDPMNFLPR